MNAEPASSLRVCVHYDFASTLCYVAHRVMERMEATLAELRVELCWSPVDLVRLAPFRRGQVVPEVRRENAARVARELGVAAPVPASWPDSRALGAAALLAGRAGREASFRERAFSALFEQGRSVESPVAAAALARDLGLTLDPNEIEAAMDELEALSQAARQAEVTGVPTFMLGSWPFGGIQSEATMRQVLSRYLQREREGMLT